MSQKKGLDKEGLPIESGVYIIKDPSGLEGPNEEIDVYEHPIKGLCCFSEDFYSAGTGVNDETDCHVSVQCAVLEFITKLRGLFRGIIEV